MKKNIIPSISIKVAKQFFRLLPLHHGDVTILLQSHAYSIIRNDGEFFVNRTI